MTARCLECGIDVVEVQRLRARIERMALVQADRKRRMHEKYVLKINRLKADAFRGRVAANVAKAATESAKQLRARVAELEKENGGHVALSVDLSTRLANERAATVAWLRARWERTDHGDLGDAAAAIERGEHVKGADDEQR